MSQNAAPRQPGAIGREEELAAVERFLGDLDSRPAALRLEGEAGSGKTTIWRDAVAAARDRGLQVLSCQCVEAERRLSFVGLGDLLGTVFDEVVDRLLTPQRHALEAALMLTAEDGTPPDRRAVSLAVLAALRAAAENDPVLLAVDDVQWLDPPSARVLKFALRRLVDERVGVIATLRTGEDAEDPLELDRGFERSSRLHVGPLPLDALAELVRARFERRWPRAAVAHLARASGGNPFYALEIARGLPDSHEGLPLPESLRGLVRKRIVSLSPAVQASLLIASAAGQPTRAVIDAAGGTGLQEALSAGVVELDGDRIRFTHPLLASTVYAEAEPERKRELHERLAGVVTDVEERARHLALAAAGPDEVVAAALAEAGARARGRGAHDAAAELYEQAWRLTPDEAGASARERAWAAVQSSVLVGDFDPVNRISETMSERLPTGPDRARFLWYRGPKRHGAVEPGEGRLGRALAEAGDDPAVRMAIHEQLAWRHVVLGNLAAAEEHARAARADAIAAGDEMRELSALAAVAWIDAMAGRGVSTELVEAVASDRYRPDAYQIYESPGMRLGVIYLWAEQLDAARPLLEAEYARAVDWGEVVMRTGLLAHLTELEWRAGDWEAAARYSGEATELGVQTEFRQIESVARYATSLVAAHVGDVDRAREEALRSLAIAEELTDRYWALGAHAVLGAAELSRGDPAAAEMRLAPGVRMLEEIGIVEPGLWPLLALHAEALLELGDDEQALALVDRLDEQGERLDRAWALGSAARLRGTAAGAAGDRERADEQFARATELHERLGYPFERARTLLARGTVERRFQRQRASRESLEQAAAIFEQLGAAVWLERARAELRSVGGRPTSIGKLTETEGRVAELVAGGRTNSEVARALYMSPKTVEWNLSKVYKKLAVHSRTELAAKLKG